MTRNLDALLRGHYNGVYLSFDVRGFVACPFFMPDRRFVADWPFPHRLPLGAGRSGTCTAPGYVNIRPNDQELKSGCNMGYARNCSRLPVDRPADAVRFVMGEEGNGVQHVRFACERDYLPAGSGNLIYEVATGKWLESHADPRIQRMAECYVEAQRERQRT